MKKRSTSRVKTKKSALGGLLLKGLGGKRAASSRPSARASFKPKTRREKKQGSEFSFKPRFRIKKPKLNPPTQLPVPVAAPAAQIPLPVAIAPTAIAPVVMVPAPTPQRSFHEGFLSTREMIRPDDRLKMSIEGFLMDQRSPHTRRAYSKDLKRFVQFLLARRGVGAPGEPITVERLDRTVLIAYKNSLLAEQLNETTVDRHLATLRSFFRWLQDDGLIDKNPAEGVRFINPRRLSTTVGFSDEEVVRVLKQPDLHTRVGAQHYAVLMILFYCGLRRSEICGLRTSNITVERDHKVVRLKGKGNKERMIVLVPAVWHALRHYFLITGKDPSVDQVLFAPIRNNRTGITEKPLDSSMIFYIVRRYAKLAGIQSRVSPHSCRATAISNARDHNVPDRAIQEFAGWASPDMITRYDKRRAAIEQSAAHAIVYGTENRELPRWVASYEPDRAQNNLNQDPV